MQIPVSIGLPDAEKLHLLFHFVEEEWNYVKRFDFLIRKNSTWEIGFSLHVKQDWESIQDCEYAFFSKLN